MFFTDKDFMGKEFLYIRDVAVKGIAILQVSLFLQIKPQQTSQMDKLGAGLYNHTSASTFVGTGEHTNRKAVSNYYSVRPIYN
jgi:hypothetical protein